MQVNIYKHRYKCTKAKILYFSATMASMFVIIFLNDTSYTRKYIITNSTVALNESNGFVQEETHALKQKYILLWTNANNFPFIYFGKGNSVFVQRKCKWDNCFVTDDRQYLANYTQFDVVVFNGPQLAEAYNSNDLPVSRLARQKYVYANIEAAVNYPICNRIWDGYFNWTWTYKLNSDAVWGYILVKNSRGDVIAPSPHVDWIDVEKMEPVNDVLRAQLKGKTKAVAWFVSNCRTMSGREKFVNELRNYLNYFNLDVDIYGDCGQFQCPKNMMDQCLGTLEKKYYFYFAFENALSEDYVTEKVLHALHHYTVPVVFGGANYSRFMPPSAYLDARTLGSRILAQQIYDTIQDPEKYFNFFRWRKYYSFHFRHETPETDDYCGFCTMINNANLMDTTSTYSDFSSWWTNPETCAALMTHSGPII